MSSIDLDDEEGEGGGGFLAQIPTILWHRKWLIIIPPLIGAIAAVAAIFLLPTTYRSSAVILVQSPQLSGEVVGSDMADSVDRRIARIREQITSRPDLLALMDKHGLYAGDRARKPLSKVVETMRKAIELTPTVATTASNGSTKDATISFELSFDYSSPAEAQAVAQDLTERLLELDASQNSTQATSAVQFLTDQANSLQKQISEVEGQMTSNSASNGRALAGNTTIMGGNAGGLEVQIAQLQRDNSLMIGQRQAMQSTDSRDPLVAAAEAQLTAARAIYSDNHPDVVAARQRLAEAKAHAQAGDTKQSTLQQLDQQIAFNNSQIAALRASKAAESGQIAASLNAQARGPMAQQQLAQLQQRLTGLNTQFQSVSGRLIAAKAGVQANAEQLGEKLTVVEPPIVPDSPHWPNRLMLGAAGPGGGLALGIVLAFLVEMLIRTIRTPDALFSFDRKTPLAVIPVMDALLPQERQVRGWRRFAVIGARRRTEA